METNEFFSGLFSDANKTTTENGAAAYKSTCDGVLDFFYHAPAKRGQTDEINALFFKALSENAKLATKALFYIRDIRGGQGERETFRLGLRMLRKERPSIFKAVLPFVAEYGRWDDIIEFVDDSDVVELVEKQLEQDGLSMINQKSMSLLAKWMPSINTSSRKTVALARKWAKAMEISEKTYRQLLSNYRECIGVLEVALSNNEWKEINYSAVPSKANMLYKNAFKKHDLERYEAFIAAAVKGEAKINSGTLYPYDIIHNYQTMDLVDNSLEALWNQLPNYASSDKNAIVVADVSGSMYGKPLEVCLSLAIYIAERNQGAFKDKFITFSKTPTIQSLVGDSLREKYVNLKQADWQLSTNIEAVFNLLLDTAVKYNCPQSELPEAVFIVSDMEFDSCIVSAGATNFEIAKQNFDLAGYTLPKIIFWNVDSKGKQAPVEKNEQGVYLVSGCSPSVFEKAINASAQTPMEMLLEILSNERYAPLDTALAEV